MIWVGGLICIINMASMGGGVIPNNALMTESGIEILTEDGKFIEVET